MFQRYLGGFCVAIFIFLAIVVLTTSSLEANEFPSSDAHSASKSLSSGLLSLKSPPDHVYFKRIFEDHDVSVRAVNAIVQDDQGFMWFGTERGLFRYDGYQLTKMGDGNPLTSISNITTLFISPLNRHELWIGSYNQLTIFDLTTYKYTTHDSQNPNGIILPSYYVTSIIRSPEGDIILSTSEGISVIDHTDLGIKHYKKARLVASRQSELVWSLCFDDDGKKLWIGANDGLSVMDWKSKEVTWPSKNVLNGVAYANVNAMHIDKFGELWLATSDGLHRISQDRKQHKKYTHEIDDSSSIRSNIVWDIFEDENSNIWMGTDHGGINVYDRNSEQFRSFTHQPGIATSLSSNTVKTLFVDRSNNVWAGNFPTGVNYFNPSPPAVTYYKQRALHNNSLSHDSVLSLMEDENGKIWIGTDGGGLNILDLTNNHFSYKRRDNHESNSLSSDVILSMLMDSDGEKWLGTYRGGLLRYNAEIDGFDKVFPELESVDGSPLAIWSMTEDHLGRIWLGTQLAGVYVFNKKDKSLKRYLSDPLDPNTLNGNFVFSIHEDTQHNMWFGGVSGLSMLPNGSEKFVRFQVDSNRSDSIAGDVIFSIFEDSKKQMWFGSRTGLSMYLPETNSFQNLTHRNGLASDVIRSIAEDENGNLWVSTDQGISHIDTTNYEIRNHRREIGWLPGPYNNNARLKRKDGTLLFGSIHGLLSVTPKFYTKNTIPPAVVFTDLKLFTETVTPDANNSVLTKAINYTQEIVLNYKQTMFSLDFSALSYEDSNNNQYAYMLEGFDTEWRQIGSKRSAVYTNIDSGTYAFKVRASNNDGVWNNQGATITVIQQPAPWHTWWAYSMYLLCFLGTACWIFFQHTQKLKFERNLQEASNLKLRQLNELKSNFMANTSHELLTPLNGIIGMSELLENKLKNADRDVNDKISLITASGKRLSRLVKDILDFSLISDEKLILKIETVNLRQAISDSIAILLPLSKEKNIKLLNDVEDDIFVCVDSDRLRHILENLMSNALKYSDKGVVRIFCEQADDESLIAVNILDNGIGISEENLSSIFQVFGQIANSDTRLQGGTGLGLALTQKLVELHGGSIYVASVLGAGSQFTFTLKLAETNNKPLKQTSVKENILSVTHTDVFKAKKENGDDVVTQSNGEEKKIILIVDDDMVNRIVLRGMLEMGGFNVIEADSGRTALQQVSERKDISLIVLDIMMPHMDGYQVCRTIRKTHSMRELPIIFFTAKTSEDAYDDGVEAGGNDFLTKPTTTEIMLKKVLSHLPIKAS